MLTLDDFRVEQALEWEVMEQSDRASRHKQLFHELARDYTEYDDPRLLDGIYRALDSQVGRHLREANARLNHARYQLSVLRRRREAGLTVASMPPTAHKTISVESEYPRLIPWGHDVSVAVIETPLTDLPSPQNVGLASDDAEDDAESDSAESDEVAAADSEQDPLLVWSVPPATTQHETQPTDEAPLSFGRAAESAAVSASATDEAAQRMLVGLSEPTGLGTDLAHVLFDGDVSAIVSGSIRSESMQSIPLGKPGTADEVAGLVSFLQHIYQRQNETGGNDARGSTTTGTAIESDIALAGNLAPGGPGT